MLSPDVAASVAAITPRTVYRLIEANQVHFTETDDGQLFVCLDSLSPKEDLDNEETSPIGLNNYFLS
jgi:hypothetical protein